MISVERLVALPLFAGERREVVDALARRGIEARFEPNAVMFLAGSEPRGWYIVLEGRVRVVRGSGSRQHVVARRRAAARVARTAARRPTR